MSIPSIEEFKALFDRGQFHYGKDLPDVRDRDIEKAQAEAIAAFGDCSGFENPSLAFNYLTAHFLLSDIQAAENGGQSSWQVQSHSAGGLSESFAIPQKILDSPLWSQICTTYYGKKFYVMAQPLLVGGVSIAGGRSLP